jgi:hypothetical protein
MPSINAIVKEMKGLPADKLEDIFQFAHSLNRKPSRKKSLSRRILSFAGAFKDMSDKDYNDFIKHTNATRKQLFNRDVEL